MSDPIRIKIAGFFTQAREKNSKGELSRDKAGNVIYDEIVSYVPLGKSQFALNHARIDKLMKVSDLFEDNPAYMAAKMRWDVIRPAYEAWHVTGALHLEFFDALRSYGSFASDRSYVLYCEVGQKSAHLAELMRKAGLVAYHVQGGLRTIQRPRHKDELLIP